VIHEKEMYRYMWLLRQCIVDINIVAIICLVHLHRCHENRSGATVIRWTTRWTKSRLVIQKEDFSCQGINVKGDI
jgi:hypothetical protein